MSLIQSYRNHVATHLHFHWEKSVFFIGIFFILFLLYPKISSASWGEDPYISYTPESWSMTNEDVIATLENMSESGTLLVPETNEYIFTGNGDFIFEYENWSGIVEEYTATVDWIDKQAATWSIEYNTTDSTTGDVIATATWFDEDVIFIQPAGTWVYIFTGNEGFTFIVQDEAGNETEILAQVTWIEESEEEPELEEPEEEETPEEDVVCDIDDIEITGPVSGDMVGGEFPIQREIVDADNCEDIDLDIMLRDHNEQWIRIWTSNVAQGEFLFDSTILVSTGIYTITWTYLSGNIYEILNESGVVVDTGVYEEDTDYIIYTGAYNGQYTGYATWYKIALFNTECDNELLLACVEESSDCPVECYWYWDEQIFTIDNVFPELEELSLEVEWIVVSGSVGLDAVIIWEFEATKEIGSWAYVINSTQVAWSEVMSWAVYTISVPLLYVENTGNVIEYELLATDIVGNSVTVSWVVDFSFDNSIPVVDNIVLSWTFASWMTMARDTDQDVVYTIDIVDEDDDLVQTGHTTGYDDQHMVEIQTLDEDLVYTIVIQGNSRVWNKLVWEWDISSQDGERELIVDEEEVASNEELLQALQDEEDEVTIRDVLKQELQKFQACKSTLAITTIPREIKGETYDVKIPSFNKNKLKLIVNTFTSVFIENVIESDLSEKQIEEIIMRLNNMFVVIKLVRDNNNTCEQNLSNYYIGQFRKIVWDTKIFE